MHARYRLFLTTAVLVASCSTDTTSTIPSENVIDLVNHMSSAGATLPLTSTLAAQGATTPAYAAPSSSCTYSSADQRFVCAPVTTHGLTVSRSIILLDVSGQPLSTLDPIPVAAIRSITDVSGTMRDTLGTLVSAVAIVRHEDMTMTGIHAVTHVVNGMSTQTTSDTLASIIATSLDSTATVNLLLPSSPTALWPLGGTITTDHTQLIPSSSGLFRTVIAFNGTSVVTITTTLGTATRTCTIDVARQAGLNQCS